jgi:hypothetical protein
LKILSDVYTDLIDEKDLQALLNTVIKAVSLDELKRIEQQHAESHTNMFDYSSANENNMIIKISSESEDLEDQDQTKVKDNGKINENAKKE